MTNSANITNSKRTLVGTVIGTKAAKTATVLVETYKKHPIYKKRVKYSKKYQAHDEKAIANVGDTVKIIESRPISATKHFYIAEIIKTKKVID